MKVVTYRVFMDPTNAEKDVALVKIGVEEREIVAEWLSKQPKKTEEQIQLWSQIENALNKVDYDYWVDPNKVAVDCPDESELVNPASKIRAPYEEEFLLFHAYRATYGVVILKAFGKSKPNLSIKPISEGNNFPHRIGSKKAFKLLS